MRNSKVFWVGLLSAVLVTAGSLGTARADQLVSAPFGTPVNAKGKLSLGCRNNPGPYISLSGDIVLITDVGATFHFENAGGTHEGTASTDASTILINVGTQAVQFDKKGSLPKGIGGNPYIFIQFFDNSGNPLTDQILVGRCVQGGGPIDAEMLVAALAAMLVSCENNPGPWIYINDGGLTLSGVTATITLSGGPPGHQDSVSSLPVQIVPHGFSVVWPKQPPLGGAGGNPIISAQFWHGSVTNPIGNPVTLGRCVQDF